MNIVKDTMVKTVVTIGLLLFALGCDREAEESSQPEEPASIGPQFWKYDLSNYTRVDSDVVYGLGGRWISIRYQRNAGTTVTRDEMASEVDRALLEDGWTAKSPPAPERYVLSEIWETSPSDLCYHRDARGEEPEHWFFNQVIHISHDGKLLCIYAEVGW